MTSEDLQGPAHWTTDVLPLVWLAKIAANACGTYSTREGLKFYQEISYLLWKILRNHGEIKISSPLSLQAA
jgi:hypothetical protein